MLYDNISEAAFYSTLLKSIGYSEHEAQEVKNPSIFKSMTFKATLD